MLHVQVWKDCSWSGSTQMSLRGTVHFPLLLLSLFFHLSTDVIIGFLFMSCAWEAIKEIFFSFVNVATVEFSRQNQSDSYGWVGRCAVCAARGKLPHPPVLLCKNCNEFFCQSCFSKVSYSCTPSSDTSWLLTTAVKQGSEQMNNKCSSFVVRSFILPHAWRVI
jgi:hypothetical protein